jgi:hypothetical protein
MTILIPLFALGTQAIAHSALRIRHSGDSALRTPRSALQ